MVKIAFFFPQIRQSNVYGSEAIRSHLLSNNGNLFAPQAKIFSLNIVQKISKRFLIVKMRLSNFSHHRNTSF